MTKAYITELPSSGSNIYKVEVPLMSDHTSTSAIFDAVASNSPGVYNGYNVGDVVIVHFENQLMDTCIIVGKLFTEVPEEDKAYILSNSLKVTGSAELPANTKINGVKIDGIMAAINNVVNIAGSGTVDENSLRDFVKYNTTNRNGESYYADRIQVMSGDEYDALSNNELENTLFFLTSPSSRENELEVSYANSEG